MVRCDSKMRHGDDEMADHIEILLERRRTIASGLALAAIAAVSPALAADPSKQ